MRFWLKLGADGFRVDMAGQMVKQDPGQRANIKLWQGISAKLKRAYPESVLISEWGIPSRALRAGFDADFMLHFPTPGYNTLFRHGKASYFDPTSKTSAHPFLKEYLGHRNVASGLGHIAVPSGNHDMDRVGTGRSEAGKKASMALICTLPGVPFIYYGDEIGLEKMEGLPSKEGGYNRTGSRTPMQWSKEKNRGFSKAAAAQLYLPVDPSPQAPDVATQDAEPASVLNVVRELLALRQRFKALQGEGDFHVLHDGSQGRPLVYLRQAGKQRILVVIQPKQKPSSLRLKGLKAKDAMALFEDSVEVSQGGKAWVVKTRGVGYGVFELGEP
jgi:glycosidase